MNPLNRNLLKYIQKAYGRVSGIEARKLYSQIDFANNEVDEKTKIISELQIRLNSRSTRLHDFVQEALGLAVANLQIDSTYSSNQEMNYLAGNFTEYGSDKETRHSYSASYSNILKKFENPAILEIGLGSHNKYPYAGLAPGGSIKAWRKAYPQALIIGADIDPMSVAEIDELGFVVDQTSEVSLDSFVANIANWGKFDLIVDDGFHDVHANLRTLQKLLSFLSSSGAYVIEDVHESLVNLWKLISLTIPAHMEIKDLRSERPDIDDNILLIFRNYEPEES